MEMAIEALSRAQNGPLPFSYEGNAIKDCCQYVASAMDLVRFFESLPDKNKLSKISGHLELISKGGFGIYSTYQKIQEKGGTLKMIIKANGFDGAKFEVAQDASRKSIELMLGLASLNKFEDVTLEDPDHSSDDDPNPDLLIQNEDKNYGIACKSIRSENAANFKEHIEVAIRQIEKAVQAGKIDRGHGIVFIDISSMLNHDELYIPGQDRSGTRDAPPR